MPRVGACLKPCFPPCPSIAGLGGTWCLPLPEEEKKPFPPAFPQFPHAHLDGPGGHEAGVLERLESRDAADHACGAGKCLSERF